MWSASRLVDSSVVGVAHQRCDPSEFALQCIGVQFTPVHCSAVHVWRADVRKRCCLASKRKAPCGAFLKTVDFRPRPKRFLLPASGEKVPEEPGPYLMRGQMRGALLSRAPPASNRVCLRSAMPAAHVRATGSQADPWLSMRRWPSRVRRCARSRNRSRCQ